MPDVKGEGSCDQPIWDGPYKMRCGHVLVDGCCVRHGRQAEEGLPVEETAKLLEEHGRIVGALSRIDAALRSDADLEGLAVTAFLRRELSEVYKWLPSLNDVAYGLIERAEDRAAVEEACERFFENRGEAPDAVEPLGGLPVEPSEEAVVAAFDAIADRMVVSTVLLDGLRAAYAVDSGRDASKGDSRLEDAYDRLRSIANADYRGNRSGESVAAHLFLESVGRRDA